GVVAAIAIGTRGPHHGTADERERRHQSAAATRAGRIVVHLVLVRVEGGIVLIVMIVLRLAVRGTVASASVVALVLLVGKIALIVLVGIARGIELPIVEAALVITAIVVAAGVGMSLVLGMRIWIFPARGVDVVARIARLLGRGRVLPVRCRRRRRIVGSLGLARGVTSDIGERIALPDQAGELGERVAAGWFGRFCRLHIASQGMARPIGSKRFVVRHTRPVSGYWRHTR